MNVVEVETTDKIRFATIAGQFFTDLAIASQEDYIRACELALKHYPNEWIIHYVLAGKYCDLGYYADCLRENLMCVKIRPNDIRSVYALATSYRLFMRADWSKEENEIAQILKENVGIGFVVDKHYSQAGLDHTGLTVETCAFQAIKWFERALQLGPDCESKNQIIQNLNIIYIEFPQFKK
jgi:hypothetical protein